MRNARPVAQETPDAGVETIGGTPIPVIAGIHQRVYAAASQPKALAMDAWHTCDTTHCRAGWIVQLAGKEGYALEAGTSTLFAAMQILKASSPDIRVSPPRFFESNDEALADMKRCAELERAAFTVEDPQ